MSKYFSSLVEQSLSRSTEATLSVLGITNPALRDHLTSLMRSECGKDGSFLAPPVFEQMFGWQGSDVTMQELASKEKLLSKAVVESLDGNQHGRYRFGANWKPFTHQLASWKSLLEKKHSVVVTSGTGSGKTECFMVPVLEDLYREYKDNGDEPLIGVRALFLYPLNALINSQRERLNAWTQSFDKGIRYCLYNGKTEELHSKVRSEQAIKPNEILSRELMRREPAPILVTNGTMLEYIMVRQTDASIIQKSREEKSLRWIILDEAHTYVGSQAAELALQLRRVMHAFGVSPKEVRFVATSATIAGGDAEEQLKKFLSDLSGVPVERIDVWGGNRVIPGLPNSKNISVDLGDLEAMQVTNAKEPHIHPERYQMLTHSPEARALREISVSTPKPLKLTEIANELNQRLGSSLSQAKTLRWLDICTGTQPSENEPAFLRLRAHFFQRTIQGLWSCFNKDCEAKKNTPLQNKWPFGYVYVSQRQTCHCGSPVFEVSFCNECNEPHLLARDKRGKLIQWDASGGDEFSLLSESEYREETDFDEGASVLSTKTPLILSSVPNEDVGFIPIELDMYSAEFLAKSEETVHLGMNDGEAVCSKAGCEYEGSKKAFPFRRALLGSPFYVANAVPTVLEYCPDFNNEDGQKGHGPQSLPGQGRRLITFTDSRQGTARMAVRMQQEAERSSLRGLVVEILKQHHKKSQHEKPNENADIEKLLKAAQSAEQDAEDYRSWGMPLEAQDSKERAERLKLKVRQLKGETVGIVLKPLSWKELADELKEKTDIKKSILLYNQYHKPEIFKQNDGPLKLAEMLMFREFMRRPKRQNSLETQGLVKVDYTGLNHIISSPDLWEDSGLTLDDWRDFLKVSLDFYVRENSFIQLEEDWRAWIGTRFSPKMLRNSASEEADDNQIKRWPNIRNGSYSHRLIKMLLLAANLDPTKKGDVDRVNLWLRKAWLQLTESNRVLKSDGNRFYLTKEQMTFSLIDKAFVCPVTNKLLDTAFKGLTPYLPTHIDFKVLTDEDRKHFKVTEVRMPEIWDLDYSQEDYAPGLKKVRELVSSNETIKSLRSQNLWTDINDRAVEGGFYYRTAEHSAQQSSERLEGYEDMFKKGQINVLNCSTTMEMGVDIGGISAVVMNNVPPHPANYLQRAGRAGRSKESRALAYTLCKGNPHDQQVFANPSWPFETVIPAPAVALNSARVVQRHVNSFMLANYLSREVGTTKTERTNLDTQWFFNDDHSDSICDRFISWLQKAISDLDEAINELVRGTALQGFSSFQLRSETVVKIKQLQSRWLEDYRYLVAEERNAKPNSPYLKRIQMEKSRHCDEYLLRDLAARTFLPGYGFPTDVVNFDNFTIEDYIRDRDTNKPSKKDRDDNVSRYKGLPSRNLAIAVREYAPGAEIVLDGRVFRSAGVSLHWHNLNGNINEAQKLDIAWRCDSCGTLGYEEGVDRSAERVCTNDDCRKPIKIANIKKVMQPAGFVTDAYASASNNIEHQKFIPVEASWVFIEANKVPLPNPRLGYMIYGVNGKVFHHSSGEFGHGYAFCLSCGRAESMVTAEDYPSALSPSNSHFPPRPSKEDKDGNNRRLPCQGSASLVPNLVLGAYSYTDVFELVLRHPVSGEFLADGSEEAKKIATTLAVAFRSALSGILGISTSELGYATRPVRLENGFAARVIQLYDIISGGAGFASSAPIHIESLLVAMVKQLGCSHCETACSECLLDSQTRHDHDLLDRKLALEWLGTNFARYVELPEEEQLLTGAKYCPGSVEEVLRRHINEGAERLVLWLKGNESEWDLLAPEFRRAIHNYLLQDNVKVDLVLGFEPQDTDLQHDLYRLSVVGAGIVKSSFDDSNPIVAQVVKEGAVFTIGSKFSDALIPGSSWHQRGEMVVETEAADLAELTEVDASRWMTKAESLVFDIEIVSELNGALISFGYRFWEHINSQHEELSALWENGKVTEVIYSDRYIQNPAAVTLLSALLKPVFDKNVNGNALTVNTLFKPKERNGNRAHHDWASRDKFESFAQKWMSKKLGAPVIMNIFDSVRDIPHHRKLIIKLDSGKAIKVRLDQGIDYWNIKFEKFAESYFDFDDSVDYQLVSMSDVCGRAQAVNGERWATDVLVEVLCE
ncbi:MAG: DEAD/DEAH box helicase [Methylobacter sp.]|uniref:DEAD/DEAH box helicase n=1 Tax=Methylobacter sp. TaxID=2051955 RepID=UPI0025D00B4D|nr:DEAD/DEAH box helicase [Methylobacter sp.]MCK9619132.1 DEAD/DEAH box helicase [Methylobacter sp.]